MPSSHPSVQLQLIPIGGVHPGQFAIHTYSHFRIAINTHVFALREEVVNSTLSLHSFPVLVWVLHILKN